MFTVRVSCLSYQKGRGLLGSECCQLRGRGPRGRVEWGRGMETPFPEQINYLRSASKEQSGGAKSVVPPSIDAFPTPSPLPLLRSNDDLTSPCGGALCRMHSARRPTAVHGRFSQTKREAIELFVSFL